MPKRTDPTLETLLDLDGFTLFFENGSWAKGRVWLIEPDEARPHGIRYELTLHDRSSRRLLGFDNAHAVSRPGGKFVEQPRVYDHFHRGPKDPGRPYRFVNAGKLVEDFWKAVAEVMKETGEEL